MGVVMSSHYGAGYKVKTQLVAFPPSDDHGAAVLAAWNSLAAQVGWSVVSSSSTGYTYLLTSPDSLKCWCSINYDSASSLLHVQFSSVGGTNAGYVHSLNYQQSLGQTYQLKLWMNCCSVFTGILGVQPSSSCYRYAVAGGILSSKFVSSTPSGPCADPAHPLAPTTEAWFSVSDSAVSTGEAAGWRLSIYRQMMGAWSACYNGVLHTRTALAGPETTAGVLTMVIPAIPEIATGSDQFMSRGIIPYSGTFAMPCDPVVAWGDTDSANPMVRGVLWDAICFTGPSSGIDTLRGQGSYADGSSIVWRAYNGYFNNAGWNSRGSLWLLEPQAANIAY